jgi:hypothetical protein
VTQDDGRSRAPRPPKQPVQPTPAVPGKARRRPDPLAAVVLTVIVGVFIAAVHHPRTGMYVVTGGLGAAALLRLVLSPRNAGSLVVRGRQVDVVVLVGLAVALGIVTAVTPFPAGQG